MESKALEILNKEVANLMSYDDSQATEDLNNLEVPKSLRLIANADNSTMIQKQEALQLLNDFASKTEAKQDMLKDDFFTSRS